MNRNTPWQKLAASGSGSSGRLGMKSEDPDKRDQFGLVSILANNKPGSSPSTAHRQRAERSFKLPSWLDTPSPDYDDPSNRNLRRSFGEVTDANKHVDWIARIMEGNDLSIKEPDGGIATHKLAYAEVDGSYVVFPTIIKEGKKLVEKDVDSALDHALKTGNFVEFNSESDAKYYSSLYDFEGNMPRVSPWKDAPKSTGNPYSEMTRHHYKGRRAEDMLYFDRMNVIASAHMDKPWVVDAFSLEPKGYLPQKDEVGHAIEFAEVDGVTYMFPITVSEELPGGGVMTRRMNNKDALTHALKTGTAIALPDDLDGNGISRSSYIQFASHPNFEPHSIFKDPYEGGDPRKLDDHELQELAEGYGGEMYGVLHAETRRGYQVVIDRMTRMRQELKGPALNGNKEYQALMWQKRHYEENFPFREDPVEEYVAMVFGNVSGWDKDLPWRKTETKTNAANLTRLIRSREESDKHLGEALKYASEVTGLPVKKSDYINGMRELEAIRGIHEYEALVIRHNYENAHAALSEEVRALKERGGLNQQTIQQIIKREERINEEYAEAIEVSSSKYESDMVRIGKDYGLEVFEDEDGEVGMRYAPEVLEAISERMNEIYEERYAPIRPFPERGESVDPFSYSTQPGPIGETAFFRKLGAGALTTKAGVQDWWAAQSKDEEVRARRLNQADITKRMAAWYDRDHDIHNAFDIRNLKDFGNWVGGTTGMLTPIVGSFMLSGMAAGVAVPAIASSVVGASAAVRGASMARGLAAASRARQTVGVGRGMRQMHTVSKAVAGAPKGSLIGASTMQTLAQLGSYTGSTMSGWMQYYGGLYGTLMASGAEHDDAREAAYKYGLPAAAVSVMVPSIAASRLIGAFGKQHVTNMAKNVLSGAGLGLLEVPAEVLAELFVILGEQSVMGNVITPEEIRYRLSAAGSAAFLMGQGMAVPSTIAGSRLHKANAFTTLESFMDHLSEVEAATRTPEMFSGMLEVLKAVKGETSEARHLKGWLNQQLEAMGLEVGEGMSEGATTPMSERTMKRAMKQFTEQIFEAHKRTNQENLKRLSELSKKADEGTLTLQEAGEAMAIMSNDTKAANQFLAGRRYNEVMSDLITLQEEKVANIEGKDSIKVKEIASDPITYFENALKREWNSVVLNPDSYADGALTMAAQDRIRIAQNELATAMFARRIIGDSRVSPLITLEGNPFMSDGKISETPMVKSRLNINALESGLSSALESGSPEVLLQESITELKEADLFETPEQRQQWLDKRADAIRVRTLKEQAELDKAEAQATQETPGEQEAQAAQTTKDQEGKEQAVKEQESEVADQEQQKTEGKTRRHALLGRHLAERVTSSSGEQVIGEIGDIIDVEMLEAIKADRGISSVNVIKKSKAKPRAKTKKAQVPPESKARSLEKRQATMDSMFITNLVVDNMASRMGITKEEARRRVIIIRTNNSVPRLARAIANGTISSSMAFDFTGSTEVKGRALFQSIEDIEVITQTVPSLDATKDALLIRALGMSKAFKERLPQLRKSTNQNLRTELNRKQKEIAERIKKGERDTAEVNELKEDIKDIKEMLREEETTQTLSREEAVLILSNELADISTIARESNEYYIQEVSDAYIDQQIEIHENHNEANLADAWRAAKEGDRGREAIIESLAQNQRNALQDGLGYLIGNNTYSVEFQYLMVKHALDYNINSDGYISKRTPKTVGNHLELHPGILPVIQSELAADALANPLEVYHAHRNASFLNSEKRQAITQRWSSESRPEGTWLKFPQGNDPAAIADLKDIAHESHMNIGVAEKPANWCTGSCESTAATQLSGGDFYIFVDKNNSPRLAMRFEGSALAEARGLGDGQAILAEDAAEAGHFFDNTEGSAKYRDHTTFTKLYKKYIDGAPLEVSDVGDLLRVMDKGDGGYRSLAKRGELKLAVLTPQSKPAIAKHLNVSEGELFMEGESRWDNLDMDLGCFTPKVAVGDLNINILSDSHLVRSTKRIELPNLTHVYGTLIVGPKIGDAPVLQSIEGDAHFGKWTGNAPALKSIGGNAFFKGWTGNAKALQSIGEDAFFAVWTGNAEALQSIGGNAVFQGWTGNAEALQSIGGSAHFIGWTGKAEALQSIGGNADFANWTGNAPALQSIDGSAIFQGWTGNAPALKSIGWNAVFREWTGNAEVLRSIGGNAYFQGWTGNAPALKSIGWNAHFRGWTGNAEALQSIGEDAEFRGWTGNAEVLRSIGGNAFFRNWTGKAEALQSIGGHAIFQRWTGSAPALQSIGKDAVFTDWTGSAEALQSIGGGAIFMDWTGSAPLLETISGRPLNAAERAEAHKSSEINYQDARGAIIKFAEKSIILLGAKADQTTRLHEIAHEYERVLTSSEKDAVRRWAAHTLGKSGQWTTKTSEAFSKGFELFLYEGKAETPELRTLFQRFSQFLKTLIEDAIKYFGNINALNDEMVAIYNQMVAVNATGESAVQAQAPASIQSVLMAIEGKSPKQVVSIAREMNVPDGEIRSLLRNRKMNRKEIDSLMKISIDNLPGTMPPTLGEIDGGMARSLPIWESVLEKIAAFVASSESFTAAEYKAFALETLANDPGFSSLDPHSKDIFHAAFIRDVVGMSPKVEASTMLAEIKSRINARKEGVEDMVKAHRDLVEFIQLSLPKQTAYRAAHVNKLLALTKGLNKDNYHAQAEKVMSTVDGIRADIAQAAIKDIAAEVKKRSSIPRTSTGSRRAATTAADTHQFFASANKVITAAKKGGKKMSSKDTRTGDEVMALIEGSINQTHYETGLAKLADGETINALEMSAISTSVAIDMFKGIQNKSMEQVLALKEEIKGLVKIGIAGKVATIAARTAHNRSIAKEVPKQIQKSHKYLYEEVNGEMVLRTKNSLMTKDKDRASLLRNARIGAWVKSLIEQWSSQPNRLLLEKRRLETTLLHMGSLAATLDRGRGAFFTNNIYNRLNNGNEAYHRGFFAQAGRLDDIAVSHGFKNLKAVMKEAHKLGSFSILNGELVKGRGIEGAAELHGGTLMAFYAISKNDVQRKQMTLKEGEVVEQGSVKFQEGGIDALGQALGEQITGFIDAVVDYLSTDYHSRIDNVFTRMYGVHMGHIDKYFPAFKDATNKVEIGPDNFNALLKADAAPYFKDRSLSELDLSLDVDFFQTLDDYFKAMERFVALAEIARDINTIWNLPDVKLLTETTKIRENMTRMIRMTVAPEPTIKHTINSIMNAYTGVKLGLKLVQIPKQATSFINAFEDYSARLPGQKTLPGEDILTYMAEAASVLANPFTVFKEMMEVSATFRHRVMEGIGGDITSLDTGLVMRKRGGVSEMKWNNQLRKIFKRAIASPTIIGDLVGAMGYAPVYRRNIANGMDPALALQKFNDYNATQQSRRMTDRNIIQMSGGYERVFTMFGSTLFLQMNRVYQGYNEIVWAAQQGKMPPKSAIRKIVISGAMANMLFQGMSNAAKFISGSDEDIDSVKAVMKEAAMGLLLVYQIPFFGSMIEESIKSYRMAENRKRRATGRPTKVVWNQNFQGGSGVNPLSDIERGFRRAFSDEGSMLDAMRPFAELAVGVGFDPFIGLKEFAMDGYSPEVGYKLLGISRSYQPSKKKASKKRASSRMKTLSEIAQERN